MELEMVGGVCFVFLFSFGEENGGFLFFFFVVFFIVAVIIFVKINFVFVEGFFIIS